MNGQGLKPTLPSLIVARQSNACHSRALRSSSATRPAWVWSSCPPDTGSSCSGRAACGCADPATETECLRSLAPSSAELNFVQPLVNLLMGYNFSDYTYLIRRNAPTHWAPIKTVVSQSLVTKNVGWLGSTSPHERQSSDITSFRAAIYKPHALCSLFQVHQGRRRLGFPTSGLVHYRPAYSVLMVCS